MNWGLTKSNLWLLTSGCSLCELAGAEWVHAAARRVQEEPHRSRRTATQVRRFHRGHDRGSLLLRLLFTV